VGISHRYKLLPITTIMGMRAVMMGMPHVPMFFITNIFIAMIGPPSIYCGTTTAGKSKENQ